MSSKRQAESVGAAMKAAAKEKHISVKEIAARMGVTTGAVYKWLSGLREPTASNIIAYAAAVGEPVERFSTGGTRLRQEMIAESLLAFADLLMSGKSNLQALAKVTGRDDLPREEEERRRLAEGSAAVREGLTLQAGRDWDLLSEQEKRDVLQAVVLMAANKRSSGPL